MRSRKHSLFAFCCNLSIFQHETLKLNALTSPCNPYNPNLKNLKLDISPHARNNGTPPRKDSRNMSKSHTLDTQPDRLSAQAEEPTDLSEPASLDVHPFTPVFMDPPPRNPGGRPASSPRAGTGRWEAITSILRDNPGEWVLVAEDVASSISRYLQRKYGLETRMVGCGKSPRGKHYVSQLFARYPESDEPSPATYTTRSEAISREIVDPIEASGIVSDARAEYDIEAIAALVIDTRTPTDGGVPVFRSTISPDEFWDIVSAHAL